MALLFLKAAMAVIPIGAALQQRKVIDEGRTRLDPRKAEAGHAVHLEWHEQPVPVDRAVLVERVLDVQPHILPLAQPDQRRGQYTIHSHGVTGPPAYGERRIGNPEVNILARECGQGRYKPGRAGSGPGGNKPRDAESGYADGSRS